MYAMLYDCVALNNNRPQRYGTQFMLNSEDGFILRPLENKEQVDQYRKELNLGSLEEEIIKMKQAYALNNEQEK